MIGVRPIGKETFLSPKAHGIPSSPSTRAASSHLRRLPHPRCSLPSAVALAPIHAPPPPDSACRLPSAPPASPVSPPALPSDPIKMEGGLRSRRCATAWCTSSWRPWHSWSMRSAHGSAPRVKAKMRSSARTRVRADVFGAAGGSGKTRAAPTCSMACCARYRRGGQALAAPG